MDVVETLKLLVSFESITPDDNGAMDFIKNFLHDFEVIEAEKEGVKNILLYKQQGEGPHLCFAGHIDVVPPGEGWDSDPFQAHEKEGFVYGRGAQDMKSGVACMMHALRDSSFRGTLSLLLTSDEEGDAVHGTRHMLEVLRKQTLMPDFVVVGEPTSEDEFGDVVKIGRRGSINAELEIFGKQGHAAYYTPGKNPVEVLAPHLHKIAGVKLDEGDSFFEPSRIVITNINAGVGATNVTPGMVKIMFNVRNSPIITKEDIEKHIDEALEGVEYALRLKESSKPFVTKSDSRIVQKITEAIELINGTSPRYSAGGGTSDARFFAKEGIPVVELGVINDRIHAINERVSVEELFDLERVYKKLIEIF